MTQTTLLFEVVILHEKQRKFAIPFYMCMLSSCTSY